MKGFGAYAGFGLDVPMLKFGTQSTIGHPTADNSGTCGDSFAVQQMLKDLGYYSGAIDGAIGSGTMLGLRNFATASGISYTPGTFPKGSVCSALMDAWSAAHQPQQLVSSSPAPAPVSRLLVNPSVFFVPKTTREVVQTNAGWWGSLTTIEKVAIVAGSVLALGVVAKLLTKKQAVANRRRRRRKN